MSKKCLAIITARGGSKRIPRKNIKEFCGKPIIEYSVDAAIKSNIFDEVMVSTEDLEIKEIAERCGAKVPFVRSEETSGDMSMTHEVILEVLDRYKDLGITFEYVCCIYPTAPFITAAKLVESYNKLVQEKADMIIPVVAYSFPPQRSFILNNDKLEFKWPENRLARSQDLEKWYHDCGQFYFMKTERFLETHSLMMDKTLPIIVDELEVQDIDNYEDWELAELKYKMRTPQLHNKIQNNKTYIIAEMSANHAGSLSRAKEIIHAAKEAGADCIKIQTYTPDTMTIDCNNEYFNIANGTWEGENLYNLYKKAYTPWEWQAQLKAECDNIGIDFFSTPFDKTSVDFLESIGIEFYKIASFELVDIPLIDYVASKQKPIILSTGMGTFEEISEAVNTIKKYHNNIVLLKCSSAYPAISSQMNLATMVDMKNKFGCSVGLSDHSMGSLGAITAVAMGANVIEKHFCLSREIENPDSSFSMEPDEFKKMVEDIRNVELAIGSAFYGINENEKSSMVFRRSIFAVSDIKKGDTFDCDNTRVIRPGYGLKPKFYNEIIGKTALQDISRGTPLEWEMIE